MSSVWRRLDLARRCSVAMASRAMKSFEWRIAKHLAQVLAGGVHCARDKPSLSARKWLSLRQSSFGGDFALG